MKPGRIFLRRLIDLSGTVKKLHYHISVNKEARADILWWDKFIYDWNGVGIIQSMPSTFQEMNLFTDASMKGLGGFYDGRWFSTPILKAKSYDIAYFELLAIVIGG